MKTIKLTTEQARELYEKHPEMRDTILNVFTDEELGIKPKPFTWYDLGFIEGYWIDGFSQVSMGTSRQKSIDRNRNIFPHESDAEKALATAQLLQLALHYNGVHQKDIEGLYYIAILQKRKIKLYTYNDLYHGGIKFLRGEDLQKCIDDNPELWNKYFYL